jgi:hypothetical protein
MKKSYYCIIPVLPIRSTKISPKHAEKPPFSDENEHSGVAPRDNCKTLRGFQNVEADGAYQIFRNVFLRYIHHRISQTSAKPAELEMSGYQWPMYFASPCTKTPAMLRKLIRWVAI